MPESNTTDPFPAVLLIDDDPDAVRNICDMLLKNNFDCHVAWDEASATDILRRHAGQISLVIAELSPFHGDGPATVQRVEAQLSNVPVLFMSSLPFNEIKDKLGCSVPADAYIQKPLDESVLMRCVRQAIDEHPDSG